MTASSSLLRPTWAEIDLDSIGHNVDQFRQRLGPQVAIMAVVKADAYGHGALETAGAALEAGASHLAVAFPDEGIELRRAGVNAPILLLGYSGPEQLPVLIEHRLTPIVYDRETALALGKLASGLGASLPVHVKVDTGMGRVGVSPREAVDLITATAGLPGLDLEGIATHFAAADEEEGSSFTGEQISVFDGIIAACRQRGVAPALIHTANSAAAIAYPHSRYNMVRLGISMYGHFPGSWLKKTGLSLRPALSFKSRIIFLKEVPAGTSISYGRTYHTTGKSLIATVAAGYADGYRRYLSNNMTVLVRGQRVPVVGRICMDQLMIDVSRVPGAARDDEVVLYGRQGGEEITVDEVAGALGTISHELLCAVGKRVPRVYLRGERPVLIKGILGEKIFPG